MGLGVGVGDEGELTGLGGGLGRLGGGGGELIVGGDGAQVKEPA